MKKDIQDRNDIINLVDNFYITVRANPKLGYIFDDVMHVKWAEHLPRMYAFWGSLLLGENSFSGNPMQKHIALSKITAMTETHFDEWLILFTKTVDDHFKGEVANDAKTKASHIAKLMLYKIQNAHASL